MIYLSASHLLPAVREDEFLKEQIGELQEYDEQLIRRLIEKVTVFDDKVTVEFKSSVEIDIEI